MGQIARQQHTGRRGVRDHALQPVLRRLRPHPRHPAGRVQIVGAQRAQFLPARRRVIGQRQHQAVADRFLRRDSKDFSPIRTRRVSTAAWSSSAPNPAGAQMVIEQPHRHQPLLNCGVRRACPGIDRHHIRAPAAGPAGQLTHVRGDVRSIGGYWIDVLPLAHLQVLGRPQGVGVDRPPRGPQIRPYPQPLGRPCRPNTGHLCSSTTQSLKPSPKSVVTPEEHDHPSGQIPCNFSIPQARHVRPRERRPAPPPNPPPPNLKTITPSSGITKIAPEPGLAPPLRTNTGGKTFSAAKPNVTENGRHISVVNAGGDTTGRRTSGDAELGRDESAEQ